MGTEGVQVVVVMEDLEVVNMKWVVDTVVVITAMDWEVVMA